MPRKIIDEKERTAELLEKILVFQLWTLGVPQGRIAKTVGRQWAWVNNLLKGIPKKAYGVQELLFKRLVHFPLAQLCVYMSR